MADRIRAQENTGGRDEAAASPARPSQQASVVDLAYREYCRRQQAGEVLDPDEYCERFPGVKSSLGRLLRVHRYYEGKPDLVRWPESGETFLGFTLQRNWAGEAWPGVPGDRAGAGQPAGGGQGVAPGDCRSGNSWPAGTSEHRARLLGRAGLGLRPDGGVHALPGQRHPLQRPGPGVPRSGSPTRARVILEAARDGVRPGELPCTDRQPPRDLLQTGTYTEGVLDLGVQLAEALAFIHKLGVCHRDLKPSNVLLNPDGRPMLLDFNLSDDVHGGERPLGGTLPYMAPEQLLAADRDRVPDSALIDARADLFALGVILYELLAGAPLRPPLAQAALRTNSACSCSSSIATGPVPCAGQPGGGEMAGPAHRALPGLQPERPPAVGGRNGRPTPEGAVAAKAFDPLARPAPPGRGRGRAAGRGDRPARRLPLGRAGALRGAPGAPGTARLPRRALQRGDRVLQPCAGGRPEIGPLLFARGRAYQLLGHADERNYRLAWDDFRQADELVPEGRTKACMGYCLNQMGLPRDAIAAYNEAIQAGFKSAPLFNNLGYSYLALLQMDEAQRCLELALQLDPNLRAAHHNRARLRLRQALRLIQQERVCPEARRCLEAGIKDIRRAIERGPVTAELYVDAARLCGVAARQSSQWVAPALEYARLAVKAGYDSRKLKADRFLAPLRTEWKFINPAEMSPSSPTQQAPRLLDPIPASTKG